MRAKSTDRILLFLEITFKGVAALIVLVILVLMAYNGLVAHQAANRAEELAKKAGPTRLQQMDELAQKYNETLIREHQGLVAHPAENNGWRSDSDYTSQLSYPDEEVMAALTIPKIDVHLPIYHGTDEPTLAKGVGHLYGTSLPVGVRDTHNSGQNAALTSHRGLPTALLFTRLDELNIGDMFSISVLDQTIKYRIDTITVVDPKKPQEYQPLLRAKVGEDRVTLITCTPFGVNTHRLIVSGKRTVDPLVPAHAILPFPLWMAYWLAAAGIISFGIWLWRKWRARGNVSAARHSSR